MWRSGFLALLVLLALLPARAAAANTITVNTTADTSTPGCTGGTCSIRQALAIASAGDTIVVPTDPNHYTVSLGQLMVSVPVTIQGGGAAGTVIDAGGSSRVMVLNAGSGTATTLSNLTITGGSVGGAGPFAGGAGMLMQSGAASLSGVTVTANVVTVTGGGFNGGGGIYNDSSDGLALSNSAVTGNSATLTGSTDFSGGGGIYNNSTAGLTLANTAVTGNTSTQGAGSTTDFNGGGGIYNDAGPLSLNGSAVNGNTATVGAGTSFNGGGGINVDDASVSLTDSTVNDNTLTISNATSDFNGGGGLRMDGQGDITLTASSIDGNSSMVSGTSDNGGMGLANDAEGNLTIVGSTIAGNSGTVTASSGSNGGGGVFDDGSGTPTYLNSTLSGNSVTVNAPAGQDGGGGIFSEASMPGSITDVTIADNSINQPGGAVFDAGGQLTLRNTILADNPATPAHNCARTSAQQTFVSAGFNLESSTSCGLNAGGDLSSTEPLLGPLQDNGGPTPTRAPAANSPAVDAGACTDAAGSPVTTDQRGVARPQPTGGRCDIGAYELIQAPAPTVAGVAPRTGPQIGGTSVRITGTDLSGATAVRFGGTAAASFTVNGSSQITATSPPGSGTVDVTVTTQSGTSAISAADAFTYSSPPAVATKPVVSSTSTGQFAGIVNPHGLPTTAHFEYGIDPSYRPPGASKALYDQSTPDQGVGSDESLHTVSRSVAGLIPNAPYHVRLVASNSDGQTVGPDQTFTTAKTRSAPPPPVLGQTQTATPVSGRVFILRGGKLVPLTEAQQVRSGAEIDARKGSLLLTAAAAKRKTETGTFGGAVFRLSQARAGANRGLSTLTLLEGTPGGAPSYASCKRATDRAASRARILQTLRASVHGRFRTSGRYAAATVRGTAWDTTDRCDGTLIVVHRGTVLVTDLVRHTTLAVHAGHRYLARSRS